MSDSNQLSPDLGRVDFQYKSFTVTDRENKLLAAIVETEIGLGSEQRIKMKLTADVAEDIGLKMARAAYVTYADATFIEALHKVGVPHEQIKEAANLARLKRQAGNG